MDSKKSDDSNDPDDPNDADAMAAMDKKMKKTNSCKGVIIAFFCIVAILVIIYFIVINVVPKKGVFQPMTKCTTCPPSKTCQSASADGTKCNWCRPFTKGTNTRSKPCAYGWTDSGKNNLIGNWVNAAWDIKHKKFYTKKHKEYTVVQKYKIASVHHPDGKGICVPSNGSAICENCTSIVPSPGNKCKNIANIE
jgi:hypothetical protein